MFVSKKPRFAVVARSFWLITPPDGMRSEQEEGYRDIKTLWLTRRRAGSQGWWCDIGHLTAWWDGVWDYLGPWTLADLQGTGKLLVGTYVP